MSPRVRRRTLRSCATAVVLAAAIVSIRVEAGDPEVDDGWLFAPSHDADPAPLDARDGRIRTFETRHKGAPTGILVYEVRTVGTERLGDGLEHVVVETWTRSRFSTKGRLVSREWLRKEPDGVFCARRQEGPTPVDLVPRQPVILLPLVAGKRWSWEGRAGTLPCRSTSVVVGRERVVATRGAFEDAWQVDTVMSGGRSDSLKRSSWFAPGVGLVQERSILTTARRTLQLDAALLTVSGEARHR